MTPPEVVKLLLSYLNHWRYSGCGVTPWGVPYGTNKTCGCGLKDTLLQLGVAQEVIDKILVR